jgi:hypothetical protein
VKIDLSAAIATAEKLLTMLRDLDGVEPDETPTRKGQRQRVEINRTLIHLAHLGDKVRVQVMDEYLAVRDHADPVRIKDDADPDRTSGGTGER